MKKTISVLAAVLLGSVCAFAQGSEAMGFSTVVRDPAKTGMGFAGKAYLGNTAWASFSNPASAAASGKTLDVQAAYGIFAPKGPKYSGAAAGLSYKPGKFGISTGFLYQKGSPYDVIDESGNATGSFKPAQMQVNFGIAYAINDNISVGAGVKYLSDKIAEDNSYSNVGADVFAMYVSGPLRAAIGASNLGGKVKGADGTAYSIPSALSVSGAYCISFAEMHSVNVLADVDYFLSGGLTAALGAEYSYHGLAFLRAGYHYGTAKAVLPSFASIGLGTRFESLRLDLAYLLGNETLGGTLCIGLGYSF